MNKNGLIMMERSVEVMVWALQRRTPPSREDIMTRWGVHRSTAHKWQTFLVDIHKHFVISPRDH